MPELKYREDLENWLRDKPRAVLVAIVARAALRTVPALAAVLGPRGGGARKAGSNILLPTLRAIAAPWVESSSPISFRDTANSRKVQAAAAKAYAAAAESANAAYAAAGNKAGDVVYIAAYAAGTASAKAEKAAAAYSAAATSVAGYFAPAMHPAVAHDTDMIDAGLRTGEQATAVAAALAHSPLWPNGEPEWARDNWRLLKKGLLATGEIWEVWTDWYEARLRGDPANEALEIARVRIPDQTWQRGPAVVNARINELIWEHALKTTSKNPEHDWDFFLSFASEDSLYARWIERLLSTVGFRVFVQFKDMPPGSNFVVEMQRGLEKSARVIVLLSPDYVQSGHCQAEWSAAYNADPNGERRKIVPFLVRATELPALAKQIVYTALIGLSPADIAAAVLRSVGYEGALPESPNGWPIGDAVDQMRATAGGVFEVAPDSQGLLQRKPTEVAQPRKGEFTPEQLFHNFAREVSEFADYTRKAKGNFSCSERLRDRAAKLQQSVAVDFACSDALAINKQLVWVLRMIALDNADGLIPANDELEHYASDLYGYYKRLEQIFPKLKRYRKMDARHRFQAPTTDDERAIFAIFQAFGSRKVTEGALAPTLSEELKQAGEGIEEAKEFSEKLPGEKSLEVAIESHADAATRSLAVWSWLSNAREKFVRSGKKAEDVAKAIESYEKLYEKLSPEMIKYIAYLLKWFF